MFGFSWHELLIVLVIVLIIFGAGKLPSVGRSLGSAISEFKEGVKGDEEKENDNAKNAESNHEQV